MPVRASASVPPDNDPSRFVPPAAQALSLNHWTLLAAYGRRPFAEFVLARLRS
jgi:hypothetical protein